MQTDTLTDADERLFLKHVKSAVDYVEEHGLSPTDALEKVAREAQLRPGVIETVGRAYNTGRQLGQWRSNSSILDKLASFPLADPGKVVSAIYGGKAETAKEAFDKKAFDAEYNYAPDWVPNEDRLEAQRRDLGGMSMIKTARDTSQSLLGERDREHELRQAYGNLQRAKHAQDESRRYMHDVEDQLKIKIAGLVSYFKSASEHSRLPYAQVEHAASVYQGSASLELLKMAYERGGLREKKAKDVPIWKRPFDLDAAPFTLIADAIKLGKDLIQARVWAKEAADLHTEVRQSILPFTEGQGATPTSPSPRTSSGASFAEKSAGGIMTSIGEIAAGDILGGTYLHHNVEHQKKEKEPDYDDAIGEERSNEIHEIEKQTEKALHREKKAVMGAAAVGSGVSNMLMRGLGDMPKTKNDLVDDDWLDLEDPAHQNELRKIRAHAMLTSAMTDPEDPISGHDPDRVMRAFNEISQAAPRTADKSMAVKPLMRKHLTGHTEPFEAKELIDMEKGLSQSKAQTPSSTSLMDAPEKLLG